MPETIAEITRTYSSVELGTLLESYGYVCSLATLLHEETDLFKRYTLAGKLAIAIDHSRKKIPVDTIDSLGQINIGELERICNKIRNNF